MRKSIKRVLCTVIAAAMISSSALALSGCDAKGDTAGDASAAQSELDAEAASQESEAASEAVSEAASEAASDKKEIKGSLEAVFAELTKEDSAYTEYKSYYETATFTETLEDGKIVISAHGDGEYDPNGTWEFVQDGDYITYHEESSTDFFGTMLFIYLSNAVAESLDMDPDLFTGYLNGLSILEIKSDYYSQKTNEDGSVDLKMYMAQPFEMKELDEMYINETVLADSEPLDDTYRSNTNSIGKVASIANGTKTNYELIMIEYGELDDLAVKSAKSIVGAHQPEGYEKFVEDFTAFEDTETDEYTVNANPADEDLGDYAGQIKDGCVCAVITFGSEEAGE